MPTTALEMTSKVGYGQRYYMQRTFTVSSGGRSLIFLVAEGGIEPPTQRFSVAHLYCNSLKKQHYGDVCHVQSRKSRARDTRSRDEVQARSMTRLRQHLVVIFSVRYW